MCNNIKNFAHLANNNSYLSWRNQFTTVNNVPLHYIDILAMYCRVISPSFLLWTHAQRCVHVDSMLYFADVFYRFFMAALVGQTAERIFTKL